jgi:hypothetical protein
MKATGRDGFQLCAAQPNDTSAAAAISATRRDKIMPSPEKAIFVIEPRPFGAAHA